MVRVWGPEIGLRLPAQGLGLSRDSDFMFAAAFPHGSQAKTLWRCVKEGAVLSSGGA